MFVPNAILFAGIIGFIAALVTACILYRRVYAMRLRLPETSASPRTDVGEPRVTAQQESMGAVLLRQREREREFSEDVGAP